VGRREQKARVARVFVGETALANDVLVGIDSEETVHIGQTIAKRLPVADDEAPEDEELELRALDLKRRVLVDHRHRFASRRIDEPARVDEDDVGVFGLRADQGARRRKTSEETLGVHEVLRAPETGKVDANRLRPLPSRSGHGLILPHLGTSADGELPRFGVNLTLRGDAWGDALR
jgi:hypothetical protein